MSNLTNNSLCEILLTQPLPKCYEALSLYDCYNLNSKEVIDFLNILPTLIIKTNTFCRNITPSKNIMIGEMKKQWETFLEILNKKGDKQILEIAKALSKNCKMLKEKNPVNFIDTLKTASLSDSYEILSSFERYNLKAAEMEEFKAIILKIYDKTENYISVMDVSKEVELLKMKYNYKNFLKILENKKDFKTKKIVKDLTKMWETVDCLTEIKKEEEKFETGLNEPQTNMAELHFDDKFTTHQTPSLTPSPIVRVFRIDENSLVLIDDNGWCYTPEEEDNFVQEFESNKPHGVGGVQTIPWYKTKNESNNDLEQIQKNQRFSFIEDVIASCKDLNENILYDSASALAIFKHIAILSCFAPDVNLDVETLKPEIKARLSGSFRASLIHLAEKICTAFQQADTSMKNICACLSDLPKYFNSILKVVVVGEVENQKTAEVFSRLKTSSDACNKMAVLAKETFDDAILDINALCIAQYSSRANLKEKELLKKLNDQFTSKLEGFKTRLENKAEKVEEKAEKSLNSEQTKLDFGESLSVMIANFVSGTNILNFGNLQQQSNSPKMSMETQLINCLRQIGKSLSDVQKLTQKSIDNYIISLNNFHKNFGVTIENDAIIKLAKDVQNFLQKYNNFLHKGGNIIKDEKMKIEVYEMKASIQNTLAIQSIYDKQKIERFFTTSLQQLLLAENKNFDFTNSQFSTLEYGVHQMELNERPRILSEMIRMPFDTKIVNFYEITLQNGMKYFEKVTKNWEFLINFFTNINQYFIKTVNNQNAKDPAVQTLMLQCSLKVIGDCIQILNTASIYCDLSEKFLLPIINDIPEEITLKPHEIKVEHRKIQYFFC